MEEYILGSDEPVEAEALELDLQRFADPIDMKLIIDEEDGQPIFTKPSDEEDEENTPDEDDADLGDETLPQPIFMPRLTATDGNLPHTAAGELVVRDLDGELYTVTVNGDGELEQNPVQITDENIEDSTITGIKLQECTITSRELDMEEIFGDAAVMDRLVTESIDTAGLFENTEFTQQLDERVADQAVLRAGCAMEGPLLLANDPAEAMEAATKQYVDEAVSDAKYSVKGDKGDTGKQGPQGVQGERGPQGAQGEPGQSAYAAAQVGGYTGTQAAFYTDLAAIDGLASALAAL